VSLAGPALVNSFSTADGFFSLETPHCEAKKLHHVIFAVTLVKTFNSEIVIVIGYKFEI